MAGLEQTLAFIGSFPEAARQRREFSPPIRAHRYREHIVIYRIDATGVAVILRVRHGHEDWMTTTY